MLSEDGKIVLTILVFVAGIFASGYFAGWLRDRMTIRLLDAYEEMREKRNQWRNKSEYYRKELNKLRVSIVQSEEESQLTKREE